MKKKPQSSGLSRRDVLRGAAAAAFVGASGAVALASGQRTPRTKATAAAAGQLRYMAAAAVLGDGRILVTGGYGRPFTAKDSPAPLNSAAIYNPSTGEFTVAAPMQLPRARHAAIALKDGRVAVIGGVSFEPTASIEVYDPGSDTWTYSMPLAQPRYDHAVASDGDTVFVIGGSSQSMLTSVEAVYPN